MGAVHTAFCPSFFAGLHRYSCAMARMEGRSTATTPKIADVRNVKTVMVADLSGSTALGERLDPEELRAVLGGYFQTLSHQIHRFGGAIDKYIGDAVRAVFEGDDGAVRGLSAGLAMLEAMAEKNEELERRYKVRLSLRIGVNTGEVVGSAASPSGQGQPSVGRTVTIAQRLESTATPNTVQVGQRTYRSGRHAFRFEAAPLITIAGAEDVERAYRLVARKRATGQLAESSPAIAPLESTGASLQVGEQKAYVLEEQRKIVTVLFADLAGLEGRGVDPERLHRVLGVYFSAVAAEIRRYGGTIDKYIGDAVMAVFGAPISHEDDAARAIRAALGIQAAIRKENDQLERSDGIRLAVRIGVNTGEVVAGLLSGEVLAYTVTGDAVNTAQRIESATPANEVLVGEETYALARKSFEFEQVASLTLKGKSQPIPAYRVSRPLEAGLVGGAALVGREAELAQLAGLFREVEAGRGALVHIYGEPGVGKSRILAEFVATLPPEVRSVSARCSSFESASPYAAIADLVRRWVSIQISDDETVASAALDSALAPLALPSHESAIAILLEILGYGERSVLDPESKRRQLVVLLRQLLEDRSATSTFIVTIEDLHWIDAASSTVLGDVLPKVGDLRCMVLTTSRDEATGSWQATSLSLGPLDAGLAGEMVDRVASAPMDEKTRALILERTGGNPFFIEEVVRSLGSRRAGGVPTTVQDLLEAKLDALDAGPKHVAQRAAVIGRTFWTRVLAQVSPGEALRPALATLESDRFVAPYETTPEEKYTFRHALVQEVVYQTQLISHRRIAHTAVGAAIVELFGDRVDEFIDILAYHYGRSDDDANARHFLIRAGERAQHLYANEEALAYFEAALARSADEAATRAVAHEGIGSVRLLQGKLDEATASFEQAMAAREVADTLARSRLRAKLASILRLRGERQRALDLLTETLADLPENADLERTAVFLELAETHWHQGSFDAAVLALESATRHAERAESRGNLADAYKHLGTVYTLKGDIAEGLRWYDRSLALFESLGDPLAQSKVLNNIGSARQRQAHYPEALDALTRALAIKQRLGEPLGIGAVQNNLGQVHRLLGDLDRAEAEYAASLEQFASIGVATGIALAHSGLGSTALERGDYAVAREHFLVELAESERLGQRASLFEPERNIALTYVDDDLETAVLWADRALASARAVQVSAQEALALQTMGIVRIARGDTAEAITSLERARDLLRDGDRHEFARTLAALARAYGALPPTDVRVREIRTLVDEARAIFAELGAALDLERLEESGTAT
jgi:adenylate cyclase